MSELYKTTFQPYRWVFSLENHSLRAGLPQELPVVDAVWHVSLLESEGDLILRHSHSFSSIAAAKEFRPKRVEVTAAPLRRPPAPMPGYNPMMRHMQAPPSLPPAAACKHYAAGDGARRYSNDTGLEDQQVICRVLLGPLWHVAAVLSASSLAHMVLCTWSAPTCTGAMVAAAEMAAASWRLSWRMSLEEQGLEGYWHSGCSWRAATPAEIRAEQLAARGARDHVIHEILPRTYITSMYARFCLLSRAEFAIRAALFVCEYVRTLPRPAVVCVPWPSGA